MADPDLAELRAQEQRLVFDRFDNTTAWDLGQQMVLAARRRELPVVVSIERNGQRLFHAALPGTSADNDAWVDRKVRVVRRYGRSSWWSNWSRSWHSENRESRSRASMMPVPECGTRVLAGGGGRPATCR
ncbi:heme-binding protein [Kutzneria sp. NPDC051319]|uniref:heme-binding protein n=1 Tax=Kutzneria sp. NPDC051319 TaxID=3155047 RepID=UPI00343BEC8B